MLTSSLTIMLLMVTILLSIHPGIKSRSEEEAGIYMSQGHYYIVTEKILMSMKANSNL